MQTNGSQALQMALDELYGMGFDHMPKYIERIESVTKNDINRAVKDIILPGALRFRNSGTRVMLRKPKTGENRLIGFRGPKHLL